MARGNSGREGRWQPGSRAGLPPLWPAGQLGVLPPSHTLWLIPHFPHLHVLWSFLNTEVVRELAPRLKMDN